MTEQWQELKETITEMRDNDGTGTQQDACKFLVDYMKILEKQMQESCEDCISRQKALDCFEQTNTRQGAKYAIETLPSVTPTSEDIKEAYIKGYDYGVKDWFKSKTQPCEDAVSRQAVKALIKRLSFKYYMECGEYIGEDSREVTLINALKFEECFEDLPPVTPKYTDEEIDKAQAVEQAYVDKMVELAVEESKRPNGKWMECGGYEPWLKGYCCSLCNFTATNKYNYCPDCGAEMEVEE